MPFHITCVCGRLTVVPDVAAGQSVRCASCGRELEVPELAAPLPPPAPAGYAVSPAPPLVIVESCRERDAHHSMHGRIVGWVAAALAGLAAVTVVPVFAAAGSETAGLLLRGESGPAGEPWMLLAVLAAALHLIYLVYLLQLRDYSCVRVVSVFWLAVATCYALILAVRLLGTDDNRVLSLLALNRNALSTSQEALWCVLMALLSGLASFLAGRHASLWQQDVTR